MSDISTESDRDAIDILVADHRKVEQLFTRLETSPTVDQSAVDEVVRELSIHAAIEEQVLYPVIRRGLPDGEQLADHSIEEHQRVKDLLTAIEKGDGQDGQLPELLAELMANVREHVEEEETELFPRLRTEVSPDTFDEMATALEGAKKMAPTHPHPHAPSTPPGNLIAGAAAGVADKVRDAVGDRSERG